MIFFNIILDRSCMHRYLYTKDRNLVLKFIFISIFAGTLPLKYCQKDLKDRLWYVSQHRGPIVLPYLSESQMAV